MTLAPTLRANIPWLTLLALGALWFVVVRLLSPQWSLYVQYNYGWAVPFLCVYLLAGRWVERPETAVPSKTPALLGLAGCALLLLPTRLVVEANPIWRAASWALALEAVGLTLFVVYLLGGKAWLRHFGFPIAFFLVAVPWPSQLENTVVQTLTRLNTAVVIELLMLLGIPAAQTGNIIEISSGRVGVDEACSGIRSLQAALMIALFFGEQCRLKPARRVALVLTGAALALLCNLIRTFVLVRVCAASGPTALDKWHDPTGVAILLVCFTGVWLVALRWRTSPSESPRNLAHARMPHPAPRFLAPGLLLWVAAIEAATAAWFGGTETLASPALRWSVRWPESKPALREVEISRRARAELKFNEGRSVGWIESDGSVWQVFYFRWGPARTLSERVRVQCARTHRPDICLPAAGRSLRRFWGVKEFALPGAPMPFRVYEFEEQGRPLFVYYAATEDGTRGWLSNLRENFASRIGAALARSRCVSQRVLEIAVWGPPDAAAAEAAVQRLLDELIHAD